MLSFNIIEQGFIPVKYKEKGIKEVSVREAILMAHEIESIITNNVFEKSGMIDFLCTFAMDMIEPERTKDIKSLYNTGRFDETVFEKYISKCENERVGCFDLFAEKHPFLQVKFEKEEIKDNTVRSVNNIAYCIPTGNNPLLYCNIETVQKPEFSFAECTRALLTVSKFLPAMGGSGYYGGVNGDSPYYFFIKGKNLFETIVLNMVAKDSISNALTYNINPKVAWREEVKKSESVNSISLLGGLTYFGRYIELIPNEDGETVSFVNYSGGPKFTLSYPVWRDPHTAIIKQGEKLKPMKPRDKDIDMWRELGKFIDIKSEDTLPTPVRKLQDIVEDETEYTIMAFSGFNPKGKGNYHIWKEEELHIPKGILEDVDKRTLYCECINLIEKVDCKIKSSLINIDKMYFYNKIHSVIEGELKKRLLEWDVEDLEGYNKILLDWKNTLYFTARETYELPFSRKSVSNRKQSKVNKSKRVNSYLGYADEYSMLCNSIKKELGL